MPRYTWILLSSLVTLSTASAQEPAVLTMDAINNASLDSLVGRPVPLPEAPVVEPTDAPKPPVLPEASMARLQILLDRAGASPGVIDGFDGDNVRKAVASFEALTGLPVDGVIDPELIALLDMGGPVVSPYVIAEADLQEVVGTLPEDYAELADHDLLGFATPEEALGERFHMDEDFLVGLNPGATYQPGEAIAVADIGAPLMGKVARLEADKLRGQLRAFDAQDRLLVAYPATIGSEDNPSPSGIHSVTAIAPEPSYTYNPELNFQQGDNTEVLELAPGPNNPVGSVWIDLSEPTYGIHGTPEPSQIDKSGSHGCVRLTNWDAEELAAMVEKGVTVQFIQ
jgi:lipoprotein-anchoring transpeptidase ErfK/SrfK